MTWQEIINQVGTFDGAAKVVVVDTNEEPTPWDVKAVRFDGERIIMEIEI